MRVGDPVAFRVDSRNLGVVSPGPSPMNNAARTAQSALVQQIYQHTSNMQLANLVVQSMGPGGVLAAQPTYRVMSKHWRFDKDGLKITFDFQEYIVVGNQTLAGGQTPILPPGKTTS